MKLLVRAFIGLMILSGGVFAQELARVSTDLYVKASNAGSFVGYVQDEFVVVLKRSVPVNQAADVSSPVALSRIAGFDALASAYQVDRLVPQFPGSDRGFPALTENGRRLSCYYKVRFTKGTLQEAMAAYAKNPSVDHVEPIGIHLVDATPNDPSFASQWFLDQSSGHDIDASKAWDISTGSTSVIVAILDTGVRYFHKDLGGVNASFSGPEASRGNMWINWAEKNGLPGVDDDGNGYVDDWIGYDFVDGASPCWNGEDCSTKDNDPRDFNGHGTHCAGIVGAINNNGYATCSTAGGWGDGTLAEYGNGVKIMACRVGWSGISNGSEVGYVRMDYCAEGFYYAANNGAKIASCSWGSSNTGGVGDAVTYFINRGGPVFKAAGNDGSQTADYLCGRSDVISVAATDQSDCKASFSTYGTWVDVSAPGVDIYSLYHSHGDPTVDFIASMSGTSMATPLAASVAALIWSKNPNWTAADVMQRLYCSANNIDNLACNSAYAGMLGHGRISAYEALLCDISPTLRSPSNETCQGTSGMLDWDDLDGAIEYVVQIGTSPGSGSEYPVTSSCYCYSGLVPNTTYYWRVKAKDQCNVYGNYSASCSFTTAENPLSLSPTNCNATGDRCDGVLLSWDWSGGAVGGFKIRRDGTLIYTGPRPAEGSWLDAAYSDPGCTVGEHTYTISAYDDCTTNIVFDFNSGSACGTLSGTYSFVATNWGQGFLSNPGRIVCGHNDLFSLDELEIEFQVEFNQLPQARDLAAGLVTKYRNGDPANSEWGVFVEKGSKWELLGNGTQYIQSAAGAVSTNRWYSVRARLAGNYGELWVDGALVASGTISRGTNTNTPLVIANTDTQANEFYGTIDEIRISSPEGPSCTKTGTRVQLSNTPPSNCAATSNLFSGIDVTWSWSGTGIDDFQVRRDGDDNQIVTIPKSEQVWHDTGCSPGSHTYEIWAFNACGESTPHCSAAGTRLYPPIATLLQSYAAYPGELDIAIRWTLSELPVGVTFFVLRAEGADGIFKELSSPQIIRDNLSFTFDDKEIEPGDTYTYRVEVLDQAGRRVLFTTDAVTIPTLPLTLFQNHPNPFNPSTTIRYYLPDGCRVRLDIYDSSGKRIASLVDGEQGKGSHAAYWKGTDDRGNAVASGVYFYRLTAGKQTISKKMVLLK